MLKPDTTEQYPFRVFISYTNMDKSIVRRIAGILECLGLLPVWDEKIPQGSPFDETIMNFIRKAHIFMPLITEHSYARPWVNQEIGFAVGMQIPILPLAIGQIPGELIGRLNAIKLPTDLTGLEDALNKVSFTELVEERFPLPLGITRVVDNPYDRNTLLADTAEQLLKNKQHGHFRHRGGLGSFSIPRNDEEHEVWEYRDGGKTARGDAEKRALRRERIALERHAMRQGCSLIMNLGDAANNRGALAQVTRLTTVLRFLEEIPEESIRIICQDNPQDIKEIHIVGDHFSAYASSLSRKGINRTEFHFHPIDVYQALKDFDAEFTELARKSPTDKWAAIDRIKERIKSIKDSATGFQVEDWDKLQRVLSCL